MEDTFDPLELLAREDKWFLGGGRGLVFAPPFPLHLDRPGFWDAAHYLHFPFEPVYTYALIDERLRDIPLRPLDRRWRPDRLEQHFASTEIDLDETKVCTETDVLVSQVAVYNRTNRPKTLHVVAWSAQQVHEGAGTTYGEAGTATAHLSAGALEHYTRDGAVLALSRIVTGARSQALALTLALGLEGAESYSVHLTEPTANHPRFALTPFYDKFSAEGLPNEEHLGGLLPSGLLYLGVQRTLHVEPHGRTTFRVAAAISSEATRAMAAVRGVLEPGSDPIVQSTRAWRNYFAGVPSFRCSDPYLEKYYYYRWYGLRLNTIDVTEGNYRHPLVCEGIGYFRLPITYSAPAILRDTRWQHDPSLALGIVRTYIEQQTEVGTFPAHLYRDWASPTEIYHADWGPALMGLHDVHRVPDLLPDMYRALERYAGHVADERESRGLYDIVNQWESGQEYMSRYMAVDPDADQWQMMKARLTAVDASVYMLRVYDTLATLARLTEQPTDEPHWRTCADNTTTALATQCWDPRAEAFYDLTPDGQHIETLHGTSFYPYLTAAVGPAHLAGLRRHLLNPDEFWTPYPVPSSARTDLYFSATAEWKGKRHNCPWNGRTWPMVNSHMAEVLACASRLAPDLRGVAAQFMTQFVQMLFEDGDLAHPNSYEHYHPFTGRASVYRGIDDYMHSWVVDLLVRFVAGVQPDGRRVCIDPFPFDVDFALEHVRIRGRWLDVSYRRAEGLRVRVDGVEVAYRPSLEQIELSF